MIVVSNAYAQATRPPLRPKIAAHRAAATANRSSIVNLMIDKVNGAIDAPRWIDIHPRRERGGTTLN